MKWEIPAACVVAAFVIALAANLGGWYTDSKNEEVEILVPSPGVGTTTVVPAAPSLTAEEILDLPYNERPLEASWYETYANILENPTGYNKGVDYTPVVPHIQEAMKKGYLTNGDWKLLGVEIDKAEAIPEQKRVAEAMRKAREKMQKALR